MEKKLTAMQILSGKLQEDINTYKLLPIDTSYEEGFIRDVINRINTEMLPIEREQKKQCAKDLDCPTLPSIAIASIIHSKNIAE